MPEGLHLMIWDRVNGRYIPVSDCDFCLTTTETPDPYADTDSYQKFSTDLTNVLDHEWIERLVEG